MSFSSLELTNLSAKLDGIGHLLRDRKLVVPRFQRSYAWGMEQVTTYWTDLRAAFAAQQPGYFLGTVVLSHSPESRTSTIIDGQQRLATTALLLSAIRKEFETHGATERAVAFGTEYLSYYDLEVGERKPRLTLNTQDTVVFAALALDQEPPDSSAASTKRLLDAHKYFRDVVKAETDRAGSNWTTHLSRWAEFLEDKVSIIVVEVPSSSDAFLVFETLNDRGIALTVADLLKNYLFGVSEADVDKVEHNWDAVVETLEAAENEQRLLDFLRHFWSSLYGATRERDLYRSFRRRVRSSEHAIELSRHLLEASHHYMGLVSGRAELWPEGSVTQQHADTLRIMRITQNWPLFLAAMEHLEPSEIRSLVHATICWSIRGVVAGGLGGGTAEKAFCEAAVRIRAGKLRNAKDVLKVVSTVVPSDEQFRVAAGSTVAPNARLTRYLLLAVEQYVQGRPDPLLVSSVDMSECAVQRILPAVPDGVWTEFSNTDTVGWSRRLGNFALLERGTSFRTADRNWDEVREALLSSRYQSSIELADHEQWSPNVIRLNQEIFAEKAIEIWPREV